MILEGQPQVGIDLKFGVASSVLKMVVEASKNRDSRIALDPKFGHTKAFMVDCLKMTESSLGVLCYVKDELSEIHVNPQGSEAATGILKQAMRVLLQIGQGEIVSYKALEQMPAVKESMAEVVKNLFMGLMLLVRPSF